MNCYKNIIIMLLLIGSLFCNTFATESEPDPLKSETELSQNNSKTEIDSIAVYEYLIREYSEDASYAQNIVGMIIGLPFTIAGSVIVIGGLALISSGNALAGVIGVIAILICASPALLIGAPILIYNYKKYKVHKRNADKRDELQEALEQYKQRQHSIQVVITPVTNLESSSIGLNATLRF
ncbi:hypothetical protein [Fibrobacter succinogenes]|uniref:hypothetical protein n=1 Tax=Fibrobacter succinogenes TaxID=833 RepID=UPI0015685F74|nr:hypothetical protein [Fibrobacter succinogenes]